MNLIVSWRWLSLSVLLILLSGCFGSEVKTVPGICEQLEENDDWLQPLATAQMQHGAPISLMLVLLEPPLSDLDKPHIQPRTADWDEYRVRSENWAAAVTELRDATDFIGWFTAQSNTRNQIVWDNVSAHYLAYRLGHGGYHRFDASKYPELQQQAEQKQQQAMRWSQELKDCRLQWQQESWFSKLKFW